MPRIYERVYGRLQATLAGSASKSRLFEWAEAMGWRRFCRRQGLPVEGRAPLALDDLAWLLLEPLVARRMLAQFGGRLRVAMSGRAPLSQPIERCFLGLGLPILRGYGMTETSRVVAANAPDDNDPATVGRPLRGVEVRIGDNLELLVRGPNVMRGYWKRNDDSARAFINGWLRTGDQATIEAGRIRILGRLKEIIVTSTRLPALRAAACRVVDAGWLDHRKRLDDANAQDHAEQPGDALRRADRGAVRVLKCATGHPSAATSHLAQSNDAVECNLQFVPFNQTRTPWPVRHYR